MRNNGSKLFLLLFILVFASAAWSVITDYSFSNATGTYAEISGGTIHGTVTNDNEVFNAIPIGFSLNFNGTVYDQVSIATNGFIAMGPTVISANTAISTGVSNNIIAICNRDIKSRTDGELMSLMAGEAPNRVFTIQWKKYRRAPTQCANDTLNFQIKLFETTNIIKYSYGHFLAADYSVANSVQVGLRGAANTEFVNRTTTTDWTTTTAGTANGATVRMNAAIVPPNGLVFTWMPPQTGTPPFSAQIVSPSVNATGVALTATLNWLSGGGAPTGYRVFFGTNNPPSNIADGTVVTTTNYDPNPDLVFSTLYYWQIVPFNDFGDAIGCPVWSFTSMPDPTVVPPYTQNWDSSTAPVVPASWTVINANNDANTWVLTNTGANSAPNAIRCNYNASLAMDDWFISPPLVLAAATFYRVQFQYKAQSATLGESMEVKYGLANTVAGMTTQVFNNANIINTAYTLGNVVIGPVAAGTYFIGWHGYSPANRFQLYVDDISITEVVPVYDPPINLTATPSTTTITLNWQPTTGSTPSGYKVFRNTVLLTPTPITATTYVDSAVEFGTNYTYYVTAVYTNPAGESVPSNPVSSTLLEVMDPPTNLAVSVTGYTAHLTWSAPGITPVDNWIHWDSDINDDSIGTNAVANFDIASRFTQADLLPYQGCNLTQVKFWPHVPMPACTYTVKVWTGGSANPYNAGTLVATQAIATVTVDAFNTVTLTTPVPIPATGELWFGVNCNTTTGYPAGCDAGPAHNGLGNMMYFNNVWDTLLGIAPTLNYDWNLSAHVTNTVMQNVALNPIAQPVPVFSSGTLAASGVKNVSSNAVWVDTNSTRDLNRDVIGYKVYRGATLINTITNPATHVYDDPNLLPGTYSYTVTATYPGGNSVPAGPVTATIVAIFNPPTTLAATVNEASVTLTWALPSPLYGTVTGYKVFRNSTLITPAPVVGLTYTDTQVTAPNQYVYYVTAVYTNPAGESGPSNNVTVQFGEVHDPPTDLTATVVLNDVTLTWVPPGGPILQDWIHYDDNQNFDSIGTGGVSTFEVAARFTQTELTGLHDRHMIRVKFFPNEANCAYNIKIYMGGTSYTNPGTVLVTVPVPTPVIAEWNIVQLPTPIQIPTTNEMWIAVECIAQAGYPAGCDDGPSIPYKSNMIKFSGVWDALSAITDPILDYNWNIQGFVVNNVGAEELISPVSEVVAPVAPVVHNTGTLRASGIINSHYAARDLDRSLTGYKVYRNTALIATITDPLNSTYIDMDLANGTYQYTVTATYTGGAESIPLGPVQAIVDQPIIPLVIGDGFESYPNFSLTMAPTPYSWILTDVDQSTTAGITGVTFPNSGAAMAYMVFNPSATTPPQTAITTHGGSKMAACFKATTPANNDWLITPRVHIGTQATLTFWAKSHNSTGVLERFKVGISTNASPAPVNFAFISGTQYVEVPAVWTLYTYPIPTSYNSQNIYIGLQCVSNNGSILFIDDYELRGYTSYVATDDDIVPVVNTALLGNSPNPFNPETSISYNVKSDAPVSIEIYNMKGQKVKILVNGTAKSGTHSVTWNGTDEKGKPVTSGVYFYRMTSGSYSSSRKMILMK